MPLTPGLKTPGDMLAKLQREHARLKNEVTADDMINFVVTAYRIIEWIKKNPGLSAAARDEVEQMYTNTHIAVCRDVANESKHFKLRKDYQNRVTEKTSVTSGYGQGRYGKGPYGAGEPSIVIVLNDGQRFNAVEFADEVVATWQQFFAKHSL
jgi:hypothetical protein